VHHLFEHAPLLEELLQPYPEVRIVLSTTWSQSSYSRARDRLPKGLIDRVVGSTYHSHVDKMMFRQASRGLQIWADVCRRTPVKWLAIDDDHVGWPVWALDRYIRTDENLGISEPEVLGKLIAKLAETFGILGE
jgi:hypothetical protein